MYILRTAYPKPGGGSIADQRLRNPSVRRQKDGDYALGGEL
jgi:hypothetical protein